MITTAWGRKGFLAPFFLVASFIAANGVDCHNSRNSGLLGAPAYSLSIGLLLLVPLTVLVADLFWENLGKVEIAVPGASSCAGRGEV